jgi:hypothetical protein
MVTPNESMSVAILNQNGDALVGGAGRHRPTNSSHYQEARNNAVLDELRAPRIRHPARIPGVDQSIGELERRWFGAPSRRPRHAA